MDTCAKCGDTLSDRAHFCPGCGVPRSVALPTDIEPSEIEPSETGAHAVEEGWDGSPEPQPQSHHVDAAKAARVAAGATAKTVTWFVGILFAICIVCAVFAVGVLVFTSFGGNLIVGIVFGGALVLALVGILYTMMRRAGFFTPSAAGSRATANAAAGPNAAASADKVAAPTVHHSVAPPVHSSAASPLKYPLMALGLVVGAVLAVVVLITYYATIVVVVNTFGGNLYIGIAAATLLLAGLGWLLYTHLDLQGMKR